MQAPHRTFFRVTGIIATNARRIGRHLANLLADGFLVVAHVDGIAVALGHFLSVEPDQLGCGCQQCLWFRQNDLAAALKIAKQTLAVTHRQVLHVAKQAMGFRERLIVAILLETGAQGVVQLCLFGAKFFDGCLGLFLKPFFTAEQVVEASRDFAGQFDVRNLILADRYTIRAINENVGGLHQGIAKKAIGGEIVTAFTQFLHLIFVGWYAFQPGQWREKRQQQRQLGMLRHL